MRLVIDMQGSQTQSRFRGIGRYTLSLTQALVRNAGPNHEIWLAVNAQIPEGVWNVRRAFDGLLPLERVRVFDVPAEAHEGGWENAASELIREAFLQSFNPDAILLTSVMEGYWEKAVSSIGAAGFQVKTAAILYDLIPLLRPEVYLPDASSRRYYFDRIDTLKKADLLLAISESSRREGIEHLVKDESKVVNISAAVGPEFQPVQLENEVAILLLKRLGISKQFILYAPGGFDSRKNFSNLIEAFSLLPEYVLATHQLVIVSNLQLADRKQLIAWRDMHGISSEELVLPGYVKDADLIALYSLTKLFVFPSLHEGFGLPALEAMACGAAVIGSNCTSIPEVLGWDEALFDPLSSESISEKMRAALLDESFRESLKARSVKHAETFSWDTSALKAWNAINELHAGPVTHSKQVHTVSSDYLIKQLAQLDCSSNVSDATLQRTSKCIAFNQGSDRPQLLLDVSILYHEDVDLNSKFFVKHLVLEFLNRSFERYEVRTVRYDGMRYRYIKAFDTSTDYVVPQGRDEIVGFFQDDLCLSISFLARLSSSMWAAHSDLSVRGVFMNYLFLDSVSSSNLSNSTEETVQAVDTLFADFFKISRRILCISDQTKLYFENYASVHIRERYSMETLIEYIQFDELFQFDSSNANCHDKKPLVDQFSTQPLTGFRPCLKRLFKAIGVIEKYNAVH